MVAVAAVVDSQMAAVEVKLAATSVKAVLFAQKSRCLTISQPFDLANSKNFIQTISMINFFSFINNRTCVLHLEAIDFHCSLTVAVVVVLENSEHVDCIGDSFWIDVQALNK